MIVDQKYRIFTFLHEHVYPTNFGTLMQRDDQPAFKMLEAAVRIHTDFQLIQPCRPIVEQDMQIVSNPQHWADRQQLYCFYV